jgi:uncharacterized protein with PhoU and TrkA domain
VTQNSVTDGKIVRNGRKNVVKEELVKLKEEMKEVVKQIKVVANSCVKGVTQQKVKEMVGKMDCITEEARSADYIHVKTETMKGKPTRDKQQAAKYAIPVIINRYELPERQEEFNEKEPQDQESTPTSEKKPIRKKKSRRYERRVLILGDSHTKGIASEVQHRLGKSSEVTGIVKPAANMEEIANTASSLTKKDVCIIGGGTRDVAKNESENGLRQMNRLLSRLAHTNVMVINVPHRYDLME